VEALTYRLSDHTTADDASRYRAAGELEKARAADPIARLRRYLQNISAWSDDAEDALRADCARQVDAAVEEYMNTPPPPPEAMFDHLYATLPAALKSQRDAVAQGDRHG
ncbi:MAG: thiamine pyrophosphate-dependent enzyme, partial [Pseudomonadota bacterium]|nr:thiamine pyrophosphate-dependent enzyme [Pseudomonadota bacterium]